MSLVNRRQFLQSAALVGMTRKGAPPLAGELVFESQAPGHRLRDGGPFPAPRDQRHAAVVIVGGGIAGLSAAWRLQKRGISDVAVLEMEADAGGNARSGRNEITGYPWAAHYVPVPGVRAVHVRELLTELGAFANGEWNERHLCQAPQERLFLHGRWQEGFEPQVGPTRRDREQVVRFEELMARFRATGRFTVPMGDAADPPELDTISMAHWLDQQKLDSPWLRWLVDYACRDDYGALARDTSAWAGVHYYAAREPHDIGPLTWPEGNGWITARLLERLKGVVHTGQMVYRITRSRRGWQVLTPSTSWTTEVVIFAAPAFLASRIIEHGPSTPDFEYSPWVTANLTIERPPAQRGAPPAWDNVIVESPSLGYVVATHQSVRTYQPRTVWTYYWALAHESPRASRAWLLAQDWRTLADRILTDLARAHPDIRESVSRIDICRMGHAMVRPTPGFLRSAARRDLRAGRQHLFFAHSDVSGLSLFEEAQARGIIAADRAAAALSGRDYAD